MHPIDVLNVARTRETVECSRHEGDGYPCCDGSGYRHRKVCAGCGQSAKALLQAARGAKSWKKAQALPLYCSGCNPRFEGMGSGFFLD